MVRRHPRRAWVAAVPVLLLSPALALAAPQERAGASGEHYELRQASAHPLRYYLSLPEGYERHPGKKWPLLIILTGQADDPFEPTIAGYARARGRLPCIVVVPCTLQNYQDNPTAQARHRKLYGDLPIPAWDERLAWDLAGVLALVKDLQADWDAEDRFYVAGFSVGGLLTYHLLFHQPESLAGAATVCGNFWGLADRAAWKVPPQALAVQVRIIVGGDDPLNDMPSPRWVRLRRMLAGLVVALGAGGLAYRLTRRRGRALQVTAVALGITAIWVVAEVKNFGIRGQAAQAAALLRELGYTDVQETVVDGMGHESRAQPVIDAFRPYWEREAARGQRPS